MYWMLDIASTRGRAATSGLRGCLTLVVQRLMVAFLAHDDSRVKLRTRYTIISSDSVGIQDIESLVYLDNSQLRRHLT
jgi:hypothetical protein